MRGRASLSVVAFVVTASLIAGACNDDNGVDVTQSETPSSAGPTGPTEAPTTDESGASTSDSPSPDDSGTASSNPDATTAPTNDPSAGDPFGWQDFGSTGRVQTGSLRTPIDYDDPSAGTFDLFVARRLADPDKRIGSLLVNPGGPGFGGSDFALYADQIYSDDLTERFDIIGWDPRGTGLSTPAIDCVDDYDPYYATYDMTPDDDAERQQIIDLAEEFQDACAAKNPEILPFIGTNNSARDMDSIRRALGEETISYFGFSYGSELGATWVTLFPDTVRAAVLDGAADPGADFLERGLQQSEGFENAIASFLDACSNDNDCAFHNDGDAENAFDEVMQAIDDDPIPSIDGRPDVTRYVALRGVAQAMYSRALWPRLESALAEAQDGNGAGLLALYDDYYRRLPDGTYDNSLEAFQSISCMDTAERPTIAEDDANAPLYNDIAPRYAPGTTGDYFCTFYPASDDPRIDITGIGAGPVLVVGTTGDPATPLSSTEAMADALEEGVLVVVVADQHTGYGFNECSYDVIDGYLIDLTVPDDGVRCG